MMARQTPEAAAQQEVAQVARELSGIRYWLKRTVSALPEPRRPEPNEDPDLATELRAVVACVIADSLEPAIQDLEALAHYRPARPGRSSRRRPPREKTTGSSGAEEGEAPPAPGEVT